MIVLQLPYPPSANRLWTRTRKGMRKTDAYNAWLESAGFYAMSQRQKPIKGPYRLTVGAAPPDKRQRDLDNLLKPISDLLQYVGLIENDHLCRSIYAQWVATGHGITVEVEHA